MSHKTELKLLACQHLEQSWSAIPSEEFLLTEEANNFNAGMLVLVELTSNRQIQSIREAAWQLVGILQNFSRQQEKFRAQGEEIEGWKQSLIYQSQELTLRKLEIEARQDELQQSEAALKGLEYQCQEVEATREGLKRYIEDLLSCLPGIVMPAELLQEQLIIPLELVAQQQIALDQHWQKLEQQRISVQDRQAEVEHQSKYIEDAWKEWQQAQASLEQARVELKLQQQSLGLREEQVQTLAFQLQAQEDIYQHLYQFTDPANEGGNEIDIQALEQMPLEELNSTVAELQQGLEKVTRFVSDQEEELRLQHQVVRELQEKIKLVSEAKCPDEQSDLEFERQRYQMLSQTLVGQRRSLRERTAILNKHQSVLSRRQGHQLKQDSQIDLGSILSQLGSQCQRYAEELQKLESQIKQIQSTIGQIQETVHYQSQEQEAKQSQLKQLELTLQNQQLEMAELWGQINTYQEILQPIQDRLSELCQKLISITQSLQQVGEEPMRTIAKIKKIMMTLSQTELAAS